MCRMPSISGIFFFFFLINGNRNNFIAQIVSPKKQTESVELLIKIYKKKAEDASHL